MCIVCVMFEQDKLTKEEALLAGMERLNTEQLTEEERLHVVYDVLEPIQNMIQEEEYDELSDYHD